MTTLAPTTLGTPGPAAIRLVRSELLKIRTTNTWWIMLLASVVTTMLALALNMLQAHFLLTENIPTEGISEGQRDTIVAQQDVAVQGAAIFTSGQFFGVLFVMLLSMIIVTNEFQHQTVTTTYLTTPHRTAVVAAKLAAGIAAGALFWLISTLVNIVAGSIFFSAEGFANPLTEGSVIEAMLLNLMIYGLWAVFGVGFGILIRSQLGATITGAIAYLLGFIGTQIIFTLIYTYLIEEEWVMTAMVAVPSIASQVAVSPVKTWEQSPEQWVGVVVMLAWAAVAGLIGILINRKRDVS
jgi:ABC-type transport system involved in multi-copper enzyme maturation permease subunit